MSMRNVLLNLEREKNIQNMTCRTKPINELLASSWNSIQFWELRAEAFPTRQMCQHECVLTQAIDRSAHNHQHQHINQLLLNIRRDTNFMSFAYRLRMNAFVSVDLAHRMHVNVNVCICMYIYIYIYIYRALYVRKYR